ncbi:unnamed protein product [Lactuca virosa]|uniref:Uncharacterized protein n=1 Tax=Lactuca virosa TaxID=75947 RepID=A0AAU9M5X2_9ASTR|nr:unnamed protein product [Lactuca virosa]
MAGTGSWSAASLSEEEHAILGTLDPVDTPMTRMTSGEEPTYDDDDTEPNYALAKHPSEPVNSPDYRPAGLELLSSKQLVQLMALLIVYY